MPHRLICLAILLFWTIAAGALFTRDVLPNYLLGPPPDLRAISQADQTPGPVRWSILATDDGVKPNLRSVGQITTEVLKKRDGWVRMTSSAWLDSAELLRGSALDSPASERIGIIGAYEVDATGNLQNFRIGVRTDEWSRQEWLTLEGRLKKDTFEISSRSPVSLFNSTHTMPYRPRQIVQNSLGPLDRMPGLQVGQTWESPVVSPLTGAIQSCRVEVVGTEHIIWGSTPILTYKVVTRMTPISAATWVRPDGLVLRQEVPFPHRIKLIMERLPEDAAKDKTAPTKASTGGRRRQ